MQIYSLLLIQQLWIPRECEIGRVWRGRDSLCGASKGCWKGGTSGSEKSQRRFSSKEPFRENKSWQSIAHLLPIPLFPHLCCPNPSTCAQVKPKGSAQDSMDSRYIFDHDYTSRSGWFWLFKKELCCTVYIFWKLAFLTQEIDLLEISAVQ